jgi:septum site-determining protein MinC
METQLPAKIILKGTGQGIVANLGNIKTWDEARQILLKHIDDQREFLRGARIALDVGNFALKAVDLGQIRDALSERELFLWAVISTSGTTESTALTLGLDTTLDKPRKNVANIEEESGVIGAEEAVMVHKTLRSGTRLQYAGNVVIIGDVNPGAEIIARGSIVVWGKVAGIVHAGAEGDIGAVVCALDLRPIQLRIADQIALSPKRKGKPMPEMARLIENQVIAQSWNPKEKR